MIERNNMEEIEEVGWTHLLLHIHPTASTFPLPMVSQLPKDLSPSKTRSLCPSSARGGHRPLTTFHLHCKQEQPALKNLLNPMFNPCSACVLGKVWERAGEVCACLIQPPGSQQCCPLMPAGQRAHRVFIAEQSVPVTSPEGRGHVSAAALPTWLAQLGRRTCR